MRRGKNGGLRVTGHVPKFLVEIAQRMPGVVVPGQQKQRGGEEEEEVDEQEGGGESWMSGSGDGTMNLQSKQQKVMSKGEKARDDAETEKLDEEFIKTAAMKAALEEQQQQEEERDEKIKAGKSVIDQKHNVTDVSDSNQSVLTKGHAIGVPQTSIGGFKKRIDHVGGITTTAESPPPQKKHAGTSAVPNLLSFDEEDQ